MTSPPSQSILTIRRGVDWSVSWPVYLPDGSGDPQDLTGWSGSAQIRPWYGSTELRFSWPGDAAIDLTLGQVTLHVAAAQSAAWDWDRGVIGVELVSPGGVHLALVLGPLIVLPEVVT